ncbi:41530_t:CDS:2, partial [Gigaspora margarita]
THEYEEGYLKDEYDALQALLKNIMNIVNHDNILEIWHISLFDQRDHSYSHYVVLLADNTHICTCLYIISNSFYCKHFFAIFKISCNTKFDIKLISKRWYTNPMQVSNYSIITGTTTTKFDTVKFGTSEEMNQVISIREHDTYQASIHANITEKQEYAHGFGIAKSGLKFILKNGLVNKFVGLIVKFIDSHSGIATSEHMTIDISQIENPKKLKHKGRPRLLNSAQQYTL